MKSKLIYIGFLVIIALNGKAQDAPDFVLYSGRGDVFALTTTDEAPFSILSDSADFVAMQLALANLQNDFLAVAGKKPALTYNTKTKSVKLIVGTIGKSKFIDQLANKNIINKTDLLGKHEKFIIQTVKHPFEGIDEALVIAGSNKRGTVYGIYELSRQIGVSPWYYWADVPVRKSENIYIKRGVYTAGEPAVAYRGIFLNDEEPALGGWTRATFGSFNHNFYEKVFELILRLKGNFLWPAMWGKAFYDDDPQNAVLADEMGVVIGTSHHEPMARAHVEWSRYGKGEWNYQTNKKVLKQFWTEGFKRAYGTECLITVGMRGDGDEPMSEESNIKLLEKIISDQRSIISKISGKDAAKTPQVWALYKEVQDYYDKGMRVPDDVTLLLCDDNWGNVKKLPLPDAPKRKGGYGMYYHFDYVGGPRNYKWINVSQVQRIWEQMNLTYRHGVDKLWIVNVGDLKPMEYPISFFLDMAWNPNQFTADNLREHTEKWCAEQFGEKYAKESARLIDTYTKYNHRITPELLNDTIYSLENYNEFQQVTSEYVKLALDAFRLYQQIPDETKDAFDELVLFPINACSNLYEMYFAVAKNKQLAKQNNPEANIWADEVKKCFERDSLLTLHYNTEIAGGKWKHMMDQIRIGYTYWQEPKQRIMPEVKYVTTSGDEKNKKFVESDGYISIEAEHFNRATGNERIEWKVIPNLGKTLSGVTTFPQNEYPTPQDSIYLEYDVITRSTGNFPIHVLVSPTLNFNNNKGLRYGISVDNQEEKIVNMNGKYDTKLLEKWQAQRINETITTHVFQSAGKHTIRFRVLEPGIVLQKIIIDTGNLKKSYLGAPESKRMVD